MPESLLFRAATFKRLRHRCFLVNFSIFLRNIFYTKHFQWLLLQRFSTKKYFKLSVNITIYMLHVLLSRASVCLCMWGFQKEKKWKKIIARSTKAAKKVEVFVQNIFFRQTVFSFTKKIIYFSESIFPGVTGNILEEYLDLIVTRDSADHFASHETIEGSKQVITVITCFYQNFWMQDIQRAS